MSILLLDDNTDLAAFMEATEGAYKVKAPSAWEPDLVEDLLGGAEESGAHLPWGQTHGRFRVRHSELTVWGGYNGSGKSLATSQVALALADQGEPACIASFEMKPRRTLGRMVRQACLKEEPSRPELMRFLDWAEGKIWLYDQLGRCDAKTLLAVMRYAAEVRGVKHFIVDSLMKVVRGDEDYDSQKDTVDALTSIARDTQMHVHLVAHMRKPGQYGGGRAGKYDLKGSSAISDLADNVIILERNLDSQGNVPAGEPEAWLKVAKQRNGAWEGSIPLWRMGNTLAYADNSRGVAPNFGRPSLENL
jgi:twinkle protein